MYVCLRWPAVDSVGFLWDGPVWGMHVCRMQSGTDSWSHEQFFDSFTTFCSSGPTLPVGSSPSRQHTLAADSAHGLPQNERAPLRHACELMGAHLLLVPAFLSLEVYVVTSNSTRFSVVILGPRVLAVGGHSLMSTVLMQRCLGALIQWCRSSVCARHGAESTLQWVDRERW